jgi:hypothetical protein
MKRQEFIAGRGGAVSRAKTSKHPTQTFWFHRPRRNRHPHPRKRDPKIDLGKRRPALALYSLRTRRLESPLTRASLVLGSCRPLLGLCKSGLERLGYGMANMRLISRSRWTIGTPVSPLL